ncbi:MAG: hypothetical protein HY007_02790 [Candidatus Sungbacteria bacterium]|nr:hypothetical protein [Candidatus Sungbacteria bacterium]
MLIFSHRGLKLEQPENTLEAFCAAAAAGFGVELDIRLTKDGDLVCIHDRNPARVAGTSAVQDVREHTVVELQALDVANSFWQWRDASRIPRFFDVAQQVIAKFGPDRRAAVHVKAEEQGDQQIGLLVSTFQKYNLYAQAFLFDLTLETAAQVRAMDPNIQIFISVGEERYGPSIYLWEDLKDHGAIYDGVWWDEWKILGGEYTQERAAQIKAAGKLNYAISPELHLDHANPHALVGYYQEWERFIAWNIDGVCTAFPRAFQEFLAARKIA